MIQPYYNYRELAKVAKLVDAPGLGPGAARCGGSSPPLRIFKSKKMPFNEEKKLKIQFLTGR